MKNQPIKKKILARIGMVSCVNVLSDDYPVSYGNYFSIIYPSHWMGIQVCNFNYENFKEAIKRFLTDGQVEVIVFQKEDKDWVFCAIADDRIPQDWYHMWSSDQGYCNGGISGKEWQDVVDYLGNRYTNLEKTDDKKTTV